LDRSRAASRVVASLGTIVLTFSGRLLTASAPAMKYRVWGSAGSAISAHYSALPDSRVARSVEMSTAVDIWTSAASNSG